MKSDKIYEFAIQHPLNATRRKAVEKYIDEHMHLLDQKTEYAWDEEQKDTLNISVGPAAFTVQFHPKQVDVFFAAPMWVRLLFSEKKKAELSEQLEEMLHRTKFISK